MSYQRITLVAVWLCLLALSPGSWADEGDAGGDGSDEPAAEEKAAPKKAAAPPLIYVPPSRGAPRTRLGGATRGIERVPPGIEVLAPEGVGLTLESQPVLYWYLPETTKLHVGLTVADETSDKPLLEANLDSPKRAGVQRVRLADHGLELEKGVDYQWFISIARDEDREDLDQIAGGSIARIDPPAELTRKLEAASEGGRSYVLAEGGVWYDAMDALSQGIDATPDETQLRILRADLLEQVGLGQVAKAERASAAGKPRQ